MEEVSRETPNEKIEGLMKSTEKVFDEIVRKSPTLSTNSVF